MLFRSAVGDPRKRFNEDRLRMLRAVRFAARFGWRIAMETQTALCAMAAKAGDSSAERIRDELIKMLTEGGAHTAFEYLDMLGFLERVLPEVAAMRGVAQPPEFHPEGDVFAHTLETLRHLDAVSGPSPALALAALLHDAGKPETQTFEDRVRFNFHDKAGARIAEAVCRRLRCDNATIERVAWLVENHMRLAHVPDMKESRRLRFVRASGFGELLELGRLDCLASHGDLGIIDWIQDYIANLTPEEIRPEPLLRGGDILDMGFAPGPIIGTILAAIEDAQLEGRLDSPEAAREFVRARWHPG